MKQLNLFDDDTERVDYPKDYYLVYPNGNMYRQCTGPVDIQRADQIVREDFVEGERVLLTRIVREYK